MNNKVSEIVKDMYPRNDTEHAKLSHDDRRSLLKLLNTYCNLYENCTECPFYDIDVMTHGDYVGDCPIEYITYILTDEDEEINDISSRLLNYCDARSDDCSDCPLNNQVVMKNEKHISDCPLVAVIESLKKGGCGI